MENRSNTKKEQYKHLLNFVANIVTLLMEGGLFAYIWYEYYSDVIFMPFFRRGNWAVRILRSYYFLFYKNDEWL